MLSETNLFEALMTGNVNDEYRRCCYPSVVSGSGSSSRRRRQQQQHPVLSVPVARRRERGGVERALTFWSILLLVLLSTTTTTMSAPTGQAPKWVNPCRIDPSQVLDSSESYPVPQIKASELYTNIALQANLAKEHAENVSPDFVLDSFKDENFPEYSKDLSYRWLPQIPAVDEYLETATAEDALKKSYEFLQYYAVGIEQILQDQIIYDGKFLESFRQMEGKLRQVLCELQLAMLENNVQQNPDVQRDVMKQEFRDMESKTARDLRDWIILRDYISCLNFIATVFQHFKELAESTEG